MTEITALDTQTYTNYSQLPGEVKAFVDKYAGRQTIPFVVKGAGEISKYVRVNDQPAMSYPTLYERPAVATFSVGGEPKAFHFVTSLREYKNHDGGVGNKAQTGTIKFDQLGRHTWRKEDGINKLCVLLLASENENNPFRKKGSRVIYTMDDTFDRESKQRDKLFIARDVKRLIMNMDYKDLIDRAKVMHSDKIIPIVHPDEDMVRGEIEKAANEKPFQVAMALREIPEELEHKLKIYKCLERGGFYIKNSKLYVAVDEQRSRTITGDQTISHNDLYVKPIYEAITNGSTTNAAMDKINQFLNNGK